MGETETVPLWRAAGRVLAQDVTANEFVPDFNRSTVDGFAVKAADTFGCSESIPALLRFVGEVAMGQTPGFELGPGECAYVPTGGELPKGVDAMAMIEYVQDFGTERGIEKPVAPGENLIYRGDDVKPGDTILPAGIMLTAKDIGTLAALGIVDVPVRVRLKVGVFSTGDEVVPVESKTVGAQVRDVNGPLLCAALEEAGCEGVYLGICPDEKAELRRRIEQALPDVDALLLSGGSSVGIKDAVQDILSDLGELLLHGIAIKPGKPTIAAAVQDKPVFGLPGHPMAACFIFRLFVRPVLWKVMGTSVKEGSVQATLTTAIPSNHGREECMPVLLCDGKATPIRGKSGLITTLAGANGYLRVPRDTEGYSAGDTVTVFIF